MATKEEKNFKEYELAFLLKEESDKGGVVRLLNQHGSVIERESPLRSITLAYTIDKRSHAYLGFIRFRVIGDIIPQLQKDLRMNTQIIRFLLVRTEALPIKTIVEELPKKPESSVTASVKAFSNSSGALTNEELERKIEEILK